jgi:hypothetical protein
VVSAAQGLKPSPTPLEWTNDRNGGDHARLWPGWQALHAVGERALGLGIFSRRPTYDPNTFVIAYHGHNTFVIAYWARIRPSLRPYYFTVPRLPRP